MLDYDVIVIGGGASGLFCALTAGQRGKRVLLLDSSNKLGKKILMSGGGRCNFTNLYVEPECFLSANPHFCKSALSRYTQWDFINLVEKHRIPYEERKNGQLFCKNSAKDILQMLLDECQQVNVSLRTHCEVKEIESQKDSDGSSTYSLTSSLGKFSCNCLVIATGGLSIPKMGATGFGYEIARQFGLDVLPTRAGLVPFTFSDAFKPIAERLSGISQQVLLNGHTQSFHENILFTHRGLSGPAALQLSSYWQPGESIGINLLPEQSLSSVFIDSKKSNPKQLVRNVLSQFMAKKLVQELQSLFWPVESETSLANMTDKRLRDIASHLNQWMLKPAGTEGYRTAEVTMGGVDTDYLSSQTMECKHQPGLYFIGEVVDVTGHLGGFNFQWAWSSAYVAGLDV